MILKLRKQIEQITIEKDEEINRLKIEVKRKSLNSFSTFNNSGTLNQSQSVIQAINFPTDEASFNETIEKNRIAQKKIHFLKQKLRWVKINESTDIESLDNH